MDKIKERDKNEIQKLWGKRNNPKIKTIYEVFFTIILTINILLSLFDFLYLQKFPYYHGTLRDILLHYYPNTLKEKFDIIQFWDSLKGIYPHRFNEVYEKNYYDLKELYQKLEGSSPIERVNIEKEINEKSKILIDLSKEMIDKRGVDSYFYLAKKDGVLEKIKNKMRKHLPNPENSAKQSFETFFSMENLKNDRWKSEFEFFEKNILFYMKENYFRWIDEDGELKDYFYKIDRWFVLFFLIDFLVRWIFYRRNYKKWYIFPIRHFYEIFNLFPPHHFAIFRLFRIISLYFRLRDNQFISDSGFIQELIHNNANLIAEEISGLVIINVIDRTIQIFRKNQSLNLEPQTFKALKKMLQNQTHIFSHNVMPEIEPLITESVHYSINRAMEPYLLSPVGPIVRLLLYYVHTNVKEGLEAIFSGPEGLERIHKIINQSIENLIDNIQKIDNQKMMIEDLIEFLQVLKKDIENNYS